MQQYEVDQTLMELMACKEAGWTWKKNPLTRPFRNQAARRKMAGRGTRPIPGLNAFQNSRRAAAGQAAAGGAAAGGKGSSTAATLGKAGVGATAVGTLAWAGKSLTDAVKGVGRIAERTTSKGADIAAGGVGEAISPIVMMLMFGLPLAIGGLAGTVHSRLSDPSEDDFEAIEKEGLTEETAALRKRLEKLPPRPAPTSPTTPPRDISWRS